MFKRKTIEKLWDLILFGFIRLLTLWNKSASSQSFHLSLSLNQRGSLRKHLFLLPLWTSTNNNDNNNKFLSIIHQWGCVLVSFQPVTLKASYLEILCGDSMDKVRFLQHPKEMMLPSDITCYWDIVFIIDLFTRFYLPWVGHVIILQRTVSFKFRLIHVHMHA